MNLLRTKKVLKGDKSLEEKGFRKWMESESVKINLIKKTSILEVSYKEKDKNLILPVLDMISKRYQEYSGKKRNRSIELAINYFEDQIPIYKNKSLESLKTVNQFAIDNDLPQTGFNILNKQSDTKNKNDKSFNGINIESNRINAANRIRLAEQLLKKFDSLGQDGEQIIAFGEKIEEIYNSIGFSRLKQIDNELIKYKLAYKKKDRLIEDLILERNSLIILIKDQIRNNLINEIRLANASMKSSERPDGVLTTYAQLLSNFNKENNTLFNLEKQYRTALLEKARSEDPWELITTPTLYPNPVAPSKRLIVSLALLSSGLLGIITTLIIEKKRNLIYFSDEYDSIANCSFISEFDSLEKSYLENSLQLIADGQLSKKDDEIAFLGIGDIDVSIIDQFSKSAKIIFPSKKILLTTNFFAANKFKNIIGIIKIGISTKKDLSIILENLNLQKKKFTWFNSYK